MNNQMSDIDEQIKFMMAMRAFWASQGRGGAAKMANKIIASLSRAARFDRSKRK